MLEKTYTQLSVIEHPSNAGLEPNLASTSQTSSEASPYLTPIIQYYLEREAEWARG